MESPPAPEPETTVIDSSAEPEAVEAADVAYDPEQQADAVAHTIEDDDSVIVPAPPMEVLGYQHAPPPRRVHVPTLQAISTRQTIIPVLLTSGVMLGLFPLLHPLAPEESYLGTLPMWMCLCLLPVSLVLIGLGILNLLLVRQQLITQAATPAKSESRKT